MVHNSSHLKVTGGEAIVRCLIDLGVKVIFGYPGGASIPIYDALHKFKGKIYHVLVRHEQGAIHAAEGFARVSGKVGVCLTTSGPGATNLTTGICDAMVDSVPVVCLTGQVSVSVVGTDAFQEADVMGITTPITKWNYQITNSQEIREVLAKAFYIAQSGRPGPVVLDITKNSQMEELFYYPPPKKIFIESYQPTLKPNLKQIKLAAEILNEAQRPYVLVGHGVLISKAQKELRQLVEKGGFPVACTLLGLSAIPVDHPLYVGFLGMHGNYSANLLTNKADVILGVGLRFDDRVTGKLSEYAKEAKIIHIDIDPAELNKNVKATIPIVADAKEALKELIKYLKKRNHKKWLAQFRKLDKIEKEKVIKKDLAPEGNLIKAAQVIHLLSKKTKGRVILVTDVGQHQMVAARYFKFKIPNSLITSGGLGTMGFGLPAAIGAKFAKPKTQVIAVLGDGGFQMTIQELGTIFQENLDIKIIIINNSYLGMVRQWQDLFYQKRYSEVYLKNPDFVQIAKAYCLGAERVEKFNELSKALDKLISVKGPYLLDVVVKKEDNIFPMIPAGAAIDQIILE